jgi:hypothetical protein
VCGSLEPKYLRELGGEGSPYGDQALNLIVVRIQGMSDVKLAFESVV